MTDDRKSGLALIVGSIGSILTVAVHPTGFSSISEAGLSHLAFVSALAHSLAIGSLLLLFLGGCGLTRRTGGPDRTAFAAIVVFGFSCIAACFAVAISGFVMPNLARHMIRDLPAARQQWTVAIASAYELNQAFSAIFSVTASLAIILWSLSAFRNGGFGWKIAVYGCVVPGILILGIASGHHHLNVHGMGVVVAVQVIWFISVGAQLCSLAGQTRPSDSACGTEQQNSRPTRP
jgi:hypothetical protein